MKLMVFDVGGTEIKYSVMDEALNRYDQGCVPTPMVDLKSFLETLKGLYLPHKEEVEGIAVSLPGFIDTERGVVNGGGALVYNWHQDVGPQLAELCGCPVRLANDGKCAALAELWKGSLRGCQNASVFIIGTGVGGGLIVNGQLVNGIHFTAGEFSFIQTNASRWEDVNETMAGRCSTKGLLMRYREQKGLPEDEPLNGRQFFEYYHAGDEAARRALAEFSRDAAVQIYNLTVLLDLEKVAIGGGISKQPALLRAIREALDELYCSNLIRMGGGQLPKTEVVSCAFSSEANQVGAMYCYLKAEGVLMEE